ncbi:hypothetical protein OSB04_020467 [Centaurea solstitialis]|uniref:Uncharacterized protein n=1 Tax=Centaurea solstitialis TaxID=347529 RepID=A0AA38WF95_9ASTR|nr:hypothetical protein OSB04_020467 [Centaurea solstitialis]
MKDYVLMEEDFVANQETRHKIQTRLILRTSDPVPEFESTPLHPLINSVGLLTPAPREYSQEETNPKEETLKEGSNPRPPHHRENFLPPGQRPDGAYTGEIAPSSLPTEPSRKSNTPHTNQKINKINIQRFNTSMDQTQTLWKLVETESSVVVMESNIDHDPIMLTGRSTPHHYVITNGEEHQLPMANQRTNSASALSPATMEITLDHDPYLPISIGDERQFAIATVMMSLLEAEETWRSRNAMGAFSAYSRILHLMYTATLIIMYPPLIAFVQIKFQNENYSHFDTHGCFMIMSIVALPVATFTSGVLFYLNDPLQNSITKHLSNIHYTILQTISSFSGILTPFSLIMVLFILTTSIGLDFPSHLYSLES